MPGRLVSGNHNRSSTDAIAWPNPMHIVATPYLASRRSSSLTSVAVMRAPVAPSGCPSEMPPPLGFTSSIRSSSPQSRTNWSTTEANASLTSITETSSQPMPAFASARSHACGLPCSIRCGSTPASPNETNRARGSSPSSDAFASLATSTPPAPSQIWLEFPAVTTPSGRNAGLSAANASRDVSLRGVSSTANNVPTCGFCTSTGMISFSNRPSSIAASARRCDSSDTSSSSSRESPHSAAIASAESPCGTICQRSSSLSERSPPFDPIGTRDIISTPAETTRSSCPDQIAAAALKFVCIDEPHWRSTVVPATVSGQPATIGTIRPMFQPCSPIWVTQPICTSSTSPGSTSWRARSPFRTWAASSSPRIEESVPFFLPIGERTASTISASDSQLGIHYRVEAPGPHTLELVLAAILERDAGTGHEVLDRARDEHLPSSGERRDAGTGADGDPGHLPFVQLALAGVHAGAELEAEGLDALEDSLGTPDGPSRAVERGEEPVSGGVALDSSIAGELPPDEGMVALEQVAPGAVAKLGGPFGRPHDVREETSGEVRVRTDGWEDDGDDCARTV